MSQINSNIKDDFQVVLLLSCFVGHPVWPLTTYIRVHLTLTASHVVFWGGEGDLTPSFSPVGWQTRIIPSWRILIDQLTPGPVSSCVKQRHFSTSWIHYQARPEQCQVSQFQHNPGRKYLINPITFLQFYLKNH